jgi:hypothetical protein
MIPLSGRAASSVIGLFAAGVSLLGSGGVGLYAQEAHEAPLTSAHAHNDYEHSRPLLDALDNGFCSVEADIWLTNGVDIVGTDELAALARYFKDGGSPHSATRTR